MISRIKAQKESGSDDDAIDYLINDFKLDPDLSDSYKDWVKWYMSYNSAPDGRVAADGKKWLDVEDVLEVIDAMHEMLSVSDNMPASQSDEDPGAAAVDKKVRKRRLKKWVGKRIEKAKARAVNRRAKRLARKIDRKDKKLRKKYDQDEE